MTNQKNIFTIAPEEDFLLTLATYIFNLVKGDMFELSKVRIILPNRRSSLKLKDDFVKISPNGAVLLPQIFSLSEMDETQPEILNLIDVSEILPVISTEKRLMMLADIIIKNASSFGLVEINFDAALRLSQSLTTLLDDMEKHGLGIDALENILPDELSLHRQVSLEFIRFIFAEYPKILLTLGVTDNARRTNHILDVYARSLQQTGGESYTFIAGSTGSIPVTRRLIKTISGLEKGYVVLPYIDLKLNSFEWQELGNPDNQISHQKHIFKLLHEMQVQPTDVKFLSGVGAEKQKIASNLMRSASTLQSWRNEKGTKLNWIKLINAENSVHEAKLISAIIRHKLGQGSSVALITSNRNLSEAVHLYLYKLGVEIDDSSGITFDKTSEGKFFIEAASLISGGFHITALLSLLKNNLANVNETILNNFEKEFVRKNNIKTLHDIFSKFVATPIDPAINKLLHSIYKLSDKQSTLAALIKQTYDIINILVPNLEKNDNWQEIEELFNNFSASGESPVEAGLFADAAITILSTRKTWPRYIPNRNVAILSPIEARLQHFDCVVLGDMTLGSWPAGKFSPWFSRNMFRNMELPFEEDSISLSAHDFAAQLHQKEVYITHSQYNSGEPLIESPFVSRVKAFYKAVSGTEMIADKTYHELVAELDGNNSPRKTTVKPAPKIPTEASIKKLSVTKIENLIKNPYAIYASEILKLRKVDELEREPDNKEYGTFVHAVLQNFTETHKMDVSKITKEIFAKAVDKTYAEKDAINQASASWIMQINNMADWFVALEKEDARQLQQIHPEISGKMEMSGFTITGKADRIEIAKNKIINIADYKTGRYPKQLHVARLISPQLLLEGLMLKNNAFSGIGEGYKFGNIVYYNFSFSENGPEKKLYADIVMEEILPHVEAELKKLIDDLKNPDVPYLIRPNPKLQPDFDDYEHLERLENFSGRKI